LDDLKANITLLVELNSIGKEDGGATSPNLYMKLQQPDMTFMKKPLFLQVRPPGNTLKIEDV
jgi:hypothetical protein